MRSRTGKACTWEPEGEPKLQKRHAPSKGPLSRGTRHSGRSSITPVEEASHVESRPVENEPAFRESPLEQGARYGGFRYVCCSASCGKCGVAPAGGRVLGRRSASRTICPPTNETSHHVRQTMLPRSCRRRLTPPGAPAGQPARGDLLTTQVADRGHRRA